MRLIVDQEIFNAFPKFVRNYIKGMCDEPRMVSDTEIQYTLIEKKRKSFCYFINCGKEIRGSIMKLYENLVILEKAEEINKSNDTKSL